MIYIFLCKFLGSTIPFFMMLYFFSRYSMVKFHWFISTIWMGFWYVSCQILLPNPSFVNTFIFALLFLILYGKIIQKQNFIQTLIVSIFFLSIFYWINGTIATIGYGIAKQFGRECPEILRFLDLFLIAFSILLLFLCLYGIQVLFRKSFCYIQNKMMLILVCPILFVAVAEQIIVQVVYGDTVVWDDKKGLIYPQVQIMPSLFLHLLECAVFCSLFFLFWKMEQSIATEQKNSILEQQTQMQAIYVQEAQMREKRMASFRHDIRNHFLVLHELLHKGKTEEAVSYLSALEGITDSISRISYTGNSVVDALLHSKLSIAQQNGIDVVCELRIPAFIADIDWCILLGNAVDNALHALKDVKIGRKLRILGRMQGDFFYLQIENTCCHVNLPIQEGIGLSNIRAVVQKYHGTLETECSRDMFLLNILLHLSPQEKYI